MAALAVPGLEQLQVLSFFVSLALGGAHTDLKSYFLSTVPKILIVDFRKTFFHVKSPNHGAYLPAFNFVLNALFVAKYQLFRLASITQLCSKVYILAGPRLTSKVSMGDESRPPLDSKKHWQYTHIDPQIGEKLEKRF